MDFSEEAQVCWPVVVTGVDEADEVEALLADTAAGLLGHVAPAGRELQAGGVHVTANQMGVGGKQQQS